MKKYKALLAGLFIFTLLGCGTIARYELRQDYKKIVYFNGINEIEAKIIGEYYLTQSDYNSYFKLFPTKLRKDKDALMYPDYWFIDFSPSVASDKPSYLVVIRKSDGEIILSNEYWPYKRAGLDWVFQRITPKAQ